MRWNGDKADSGVLMQIDCVTSVTYSHASKIVPCVGTGSQGFRSERRRQFSEVSREAVVTGFKGD